VRATGLSDVTAIAGGYGHGLARKSDGTVWVWGYNGTGQLADGTTTDRWSPVRIYGMKAVTAIAAGAGHSLFISHRPIRADLDADADADLDDFVQLQACFGGPNRPPADNCMADADLDVDGDVDLSDFAVFQSCFNGPNRRPACS
jgi:hypothetical protein